MTDNHLRCALIYRLDGNSSPVLLSKYDHASQYENSGGEEGGLYGGRDKNYADAVALVIGKDPPSPPAEPSTLGGFKVVQSAVHQVVYGVDTDGLCAATIVGLKYPSRVAIQMIKELHQKFSDNFGIQVASATINSLSKKSKPIMSSTCKKYSDLSGVDKTTALIEKVDEVKMSMQSNIAGMLANTEQAEGIAQQSEQLNEQANVFKKKSTTLKKEMRCKNMKMTVILVFVVLGILAVIIVPIILRFTNAAKSN
mmetsp:Transcript_12076/g.17497  ORF Transcript_12076/g.17497 Transcript_12076/m.17497 type:complete len:254 (+) Transcript_12076:144-905(+)|eukprot:CAMPEP_0195516896 /NCGR_PEP_ID=MMETSP0794_2-20130614/9002_1 /TAXON_ID=515487 /ORGANISM="Stephanopyxis turris, Strain CCMP 815" /LENGTH=253 /DNA_ID=CAMNT_0040645607 /DNA_START=139 /DNA_END=900 /DNA_ORIENTATION=+